CYFRLAGGDGRLLLVVHHLAVDGVSWRVLLDELHTGHRLAVAGESVTLPEISCSFSRWAIELAKYAKQPEVLPESPWWTAALVQGNVPAVLSGGGGQSYGASLEHELTLTATATARLLAAAPSAYRLRVDELLLAALSWTLADWTGESGVSVHLEGHGRE